MSAPRTLARNALAAASECAVELAGVCELVEEDEVGMSVEDLAAVARVLAGDLERLVERLAD